MHELDAGAHAVETSYLLEQILSEELLGGGFRIPNVEVGGLTPFGIEREMWDSQTSFQFKNHTCDMAAG